MNGWFWQALIGPILGCLLQGHQPPIHGSQPTSLLCTGITSRTGANSPSGRVICAIHPLLRLGPIGPILVVIADALGVVSAQVDGHAGIPVAVAEGVTLAVVEGVGWEEVLGGFGGDVSVALGLDAVVHVPRDQAPANFGDAGKVVRRAGAGAGLSQGRGEGAADDGEEGGGQDCGEMHCGNFGYVGLWRVCFNMGF